MTMAARPRKTGRAPLSPLRTRVHQILPYSPKELAMTSVAAVAAACAATSSSAASSAASDGGWTSVLTGAPWWRRGGRPGRGGGEAPGGARGHQFDDRLVVVLVQRPDRDHLAQTQYRHPVG